MTKVKVREWTAYYDVDGEPWAVFLEGHDHDLRTLKSLACKEEMRRAICCDDIYFCNNLNVGRWWIRNAGASACDPDRPWEWCDEGDRGAHPITGAKF